MVLKEQQPPESNKSINSDAKPAENSLCDAAGQVVAGIGDAIAQATSQAGKAGAIATEAIGTAATTAAKQTQDLLDFATEEAGKLLAIVGDNPVLKQVIKVFKADWLLSLVGSVDIASAEAAVKKLQQEYPQESPSAIAHRIMVEKAVYAGGIGLVSSVLPGVAVALLAVDLVATTQLQAEMLYQIAAAYGMDLHSPARRGEVFGIFGLSLGGSEALKAGLGLLRNVPLAGMAIGASTNAVMLYTLGYAACRFYEAKVNPLTSPAVAEEIQRESEEYLTVAIAQQAIMDQILVHQILASYPDKSWSDILPELQELNLTPVTLEAIAANIQSPMPLDQLLEQLNRDYAMAMLARCYTISQLDCVVTEEEQKLMVAIASKFNIDLKAVEEAVKADLTSSDRV
ncbi:hypothetical protein [Kamptonema sp. UHCC 0994]|uniref:hypothetical protein n=1 Tax=Kamptonema sp. UHCC 0994 TaxID=3031329 RepID=UPI0023BA244F|nr:hypothetical protein [Kamptonema sp. UHCC 0994]MDF0551933.1 hypothetical protein [Kamptonema sp. UHCC 0994]